MRHNWIPEESFLILFTWLVIRWLTREFRSHLFFSLLQFCIIIDFFRGALDRFTLLRILTFPCRKLKFTHILALGLRFAFSFTLLSALVELLQSEWTCLLSIVGLGVTWRFLSLLLSFLLYVIVHLGDHCLCYILDFPLNFWIDTCKIATTLLAPLFHWASLRLLLHCLMRVILLKILLVTIFINVLAGLRFGHFLWSQTLFIPTLLLLQKFPLLG